MNEAVTLEGLHNFREVGGMTADGARLAPGLLHRSDSWHEATEADVRLLTTDLGIRTIVDLRGTQEAAADGVSRHLPDSVAYHHLPMDRGAGTAVEGGRSGELVAARYLEYLQLCAPSIVGAVRLLADPAAGPAVVHCRVGKDRTGAVIAITLAAVGVEPRWIVEDYAMTTANMPRILARLRTSPVYRANVQRLPAEMYSSEASTMELFLDHLDRVGGAAGWLLDHGLTPGELATLRERLIR